MSESNAPQPDLSVGATISAIPDLKHRQDCITLIQMMQKATGEAPAMWDKGIVGFGQYSFQDEDGDEQQMCRVGFASRKQDLAIYILTGFDAYQPLLAKLGRHKTTQACVYVRRLADIDVDVLRELIEQSVEEMKRRHP